MYVYKCCRAKRASLALGQRRGWKGKRRGRETRPVVEANANVVRNLRKGRERFSDGKASRSIRTPSLGRRYPDEIPKGIVPICGRAWGTFRSDAVTTKQYVDEYSGCLVDDLLRSIANAILWILTNILAGYVVYVRETFPAMETYSPEPDRDNCQTAPCKAPGTLPQ